MTAISTRDATTTTAQPGAAPVRKARKNDRQPRRFVCASGNHLVQVTLKGGIIATIEATDFDGVVGRGFSNQWCRISDGKGHAYAGVWGPGSSTILMVARLILDVPRGQVIRYVDHNPMNLRRSNLLMGEGFSKQRETDVKLEMHGGTTW